jgi:3-hydroxyacyl-[acyl-carrier-protein] dehydratase
MDPKAIIPHREPFLFLTEVTEIVNLTSGKGYLELTGEEWFFKGHFPSRPTMPGVLMIEALAQLGAYVVLSNEKFKGKLPLFGGIDKARFRQQVLPKDTLWLEVSLNKMGSKGGTGTGVAKVNGKVACETTMLFVLVNT